MNHFSLKNKVVFITGGCSGIGLAVTKRFLESGAHVYVGDLNPNIDIKRSEKLRLLQLDVSKEADVRNTFDIIKKEQSHLDVLINNAGVGFLPGNMSDASTDLWKTIFDINVMGVMYCIKYGGPLVRPGGSIINTASQAAFTKIGGMEPYASSKSAVVSITETAALELSDRSIRVNTVCPSNTKTPMMQTAEDAEISELLSKTLSPSGRAAEVGDLVGVYHFLASDESRYINGQSIVVDGGWTAGVSNQTLNSILG